MKKIILLAVTVCVMVCFTGCGLLDMAKEKAVEGLEKKLEELEVENKSQEEPEDKENKEVDNENEPATQKKEKITWKDKDYVFEFQYKIGENMQTPVKFTRTGKYGYFDNGEDAFVNTLVVEEEGGGTKTYKLFPKVMKGTIIINENGDLNKIDSLEHSFMSEKPNEEMKKVGEEKIAGRTAEKYYVEKTIPKLGKDGSDLVMKNTMWIDKELGIALKQEAYAGETPQQYFEVTSLEFKTVAPESVIPDLTQYNFSQEDEE